MIARLLLLFLGLSSLPLAAAGSRDLLRPNWPQAIGLRYGMSVAVADLDRDGFGEIIGCSFDGYVRVWDHAANQLPGWPYVAQGTGEVNATPACVDLDEDGDLEIILSIPTDGVQAWHHDGTPVDGWPKTFVSPQGPFAAVSAGNLDADPGPELVVSVNEPLALYAWHADGSLLPGWPRSFDAGWWSHSTTALSDIEGDGIDEIVFVRWIRTTPQGPYETMVHLIDAAGVDLPGWPVSLGDGFTACSPSVGDVDQDGQLEIVVTTGPWMYIFDTTGALEPGWPYTFYTRALPSSPPLGELDADEMMETVQVVGSDEYNALNHDGTLLPGWPVDVSPLHLLTSTLLPSPILADVDGDGHHDVLIVGSSGNRFYAFDRFGQPLPDWPLWIPGHGEMGVNHCTPVVADPDGDGDIEIVCASGSGAVYVWDLATHFEDRSDGWCSIHRDLANTRFVDPSGGQSIAEQPLLGQRLRWIGPPGPVHGEARLRWTQPAGPVSLEVFGIGGERMATPFEGPASPGAHDLIWAARDAGGRLLETGVYWVRIRCGSQQASQRIMILK